MGLAAERLSSKETNGFEKLLVSPVLLTEGAGEGRGKLQCGYGLALTQRSVRGNRCEQGTGDCVLCLLCTAPEWGAQPKCCGEAAPINETFKVDTPQDH